LGLYYTKNVVESLFSIFDDACYVIKEIQGEALETAEWDANVETLGALLSRIKNSETRHTINERYIKFVSQAKKTPNDRAHSFDVI
jgi:hypothetical protein